MGILFVEDPDGTRIDFLLADMSFDLHAIERAERIKLGDVSAMVCSAEDLIIYKLLSSRPRDYDDARSVVRRQGKGLDRGYVEMWLRQFEAALDDSTLIASFRSL